MADVLIVCVREDEAQAKTLADMFEAAGFSVGGAPANDAALRSSGAGVIVWSQSSIRSRPFLDAAQRVINAGKGVLACLIEPPPPESVSDSLAFDLSHWNGENDDPLLNPMFFAVDRMVNSARAAVGANAADSATAYDAPPTRSAPQPSYSRPRSPPPPRTPQQTPLPPGFEMRTRTPDRSADRPPPRGNDPMAAEAEHWRAIRHSNDPTVFLDFLARYGPDSAFAELADQRLKQIETSQQGLRGAARAASEPARNYEPTPRRRSEPPPPRAYEPPPRRAEPPPRTPEPQRRREASYERDYRPPIDTRDDGRREGGFLRGLVLLVLIGGAAVAGGVYFGLGDRLQGLTASLNTPAAQTDEVQAATTEPDSAPVTESGEASTALEAVPLAETLAPVGAEPAPARERPRQVAANTARAAPPTQQRDASDTFVPPPVTSWGGASSTPASSGYTGGPVSLVPNLPVVTTPQSSPTQPAPQQLASNTAPANATPAGPAPAVVWAQRPSGARLAAAYPRSALRDRAAGSAVLDCVVRSDLGVTCAIANETPPTAGFGRAALTVISQYRSNPALSNGQTAVGARTRIAISFRPPAD